MSLLCPIDFRYGRPKMKAIFDEETRLQRLLDVEAALARAEAKAGVISTDAAKGISQHANTKEVTPERVAELEKETRHDLMAVVLALTEASGAQAGKHVHYGGTSNDISGTATALELRDAIARADRAHREWSKASTVAERAALVRRVGQLHTERRKELAEINAAEMGKPIGQARGEVALRLRESTRLMPGSRGPCRRASSSLPSRSRQLQGGPATAPQVT